ncbi:MAG: ribosomal protein L7/L12 [Anaerolineales bacterium]|nr:ribosomal protein L7/L12 [Anaerolineales bacterium]
MGMSQEEATRINELQARVSELERRLEFVMNHLQLKYVAPTGVDPALQAVAAWLRKGNKIEAIKAYRQVTNTGLAEAKAAVDALENQLNLRLPPSNTFNSF